jgi:hypothetical protein
MWTFTLPLFRNTVPRSLQKVDGSRLAKGWTHLQRYHSENNPAFKMSTTSGTVYNVNFWLSQARSKVRYQKLRESNRTDLYTRSKLLITLPKLLAVWFPLMPLLRSASFQQPSLSVIRLDAITPIAISLLAVVAAITTGFKINSTVWSSSTPCNVPDE